MFTSTYRQATIIYFLSTCFQQKFMVYATVKKLNKEHILYSFAKQRLLSSKILTVFLVFRTSVPPH